MSRLPCLTAALVWAAVAPCAHAQTSNFSNFIGLYVIISSNKYSHSGASKSSPAIILPIFIPIHFINPNRLNTNTCLLKN